MAPMRGTALSRVRVTVAVVLCVALVAGLWMSSPVLAKSGRVQKAPRASQQQPERRLEPSEVIVGRWLVGLDSPESRAPVSKALRNMGAEVTHVSYKGTVVEFEASNEIAVLAQGLEGVRYVEPLVRASAVYTPADPEYVHQWGLPRIGAPTAWDETRGSSDVLIAIIDTGVLLSHGDLDAHIDTVNGYDFANNDPTANDDQGHGTHVAGIAAAMANGVYGVGVAPDCTILPVKVLDANGDGDSYEIAVGIQWAADHGADVINLSLGSYSFSQVEADAVAYAQAKDVVVVGASGNDSLKYVTYPAGLPGVIAVGATNSSDVASFFSNGGPRLDLAAPGQTILSTSLTGGMTMMDGTSMAAPFVSGAAALVRSKFPELTEAQVVACLEASARDLGAAGKDDSYGRGLLDVTAALSRAAQLQTWDVPGVALPPSPVSASVDADYGTDRVYAVPLAAGQKLTVSMNGPSDADFDLYLFKPGVATVYGADPAWTATKSEGSTSFESLTYTAASSGTFYLDVRALEGTGSYTLTWDRQAAPDTTRPTVSITYPADGATVSGSVALAATASDDTRVARIEFRVDGVLLASDFTAPYAGTWDASSASPGPHTITASAYDAAGNSAISGVSVTVPDTTKPSVWIDAPANGSEVSGSVALIATARDNAGIARVEFRVDGVLISSDASAPYGATWDASAVPPGLHIITATAFDAAGNFSVTTAGVTVPAPPDTTKPFVSITSPADGAVASGFVNIAALASDKVGVAKVEFRIDGALLLSDADAPYAAMWDASAASPGSHTITATAYDAANNTGVSSVSVSVPAPPIVATTLTGTSGTVTTAYNGSLAVYADLKGGAAPLPGRAVYLEYSSNGSTGWSRTAAAIAQPISGRYQTTVRRTTTLYYRFSFDGDAIYGAATGRSIKVYPKPYLTNPYAPSYAHRSRAFTTYGYLKPGHSSGSYAVRIYKYRYVSGAWKSYGFTTAKASNYSGYTKYIKALSLPYVGKWRLRAYAPADSGHAAAWSSGYDYVTVR